MSSNIYTFTTQFSQNTGYYLSADIGDAVALRAGTPFGQLLLAVFNSIFQVFLLCVAGYILAKNGILDKKTQKQINRLNVSLFTPALLFSKVAFYLTPEKLKELWIIPIWFALVTCASMAVARVLGWAGGLRQSQRSFVAAAAMFMNSNALPIALMQSLVVSVPDLAWGDDDNKNAMLGRALTYLTMYSTLGMVVRYSYGVALLSRADTVLMPADGEAGTGAQDGERGPLLRDHDGDHEHDCDANHYFDHDHEDEHYPDHDHDGHLSGSASASTLAAHPSQKSLARAESPAHSHSDNDGTNDTRSYAAVAAAAPTAISVDMRDYLTHEGAFVGSPGALSGLSPSMARKGDHYFVNHDDSRENRHPASGTVEYADAATQANTLGAQPKRPAPAPPPTPPATIGAGIAERLARPAPARRNTTFYNSFPNSPNRSRAELPVLEDEDGSSSGSESDGELAGIGMDIEAQIEAPGKYRVPGQADTPIAPRQPVQARCPSSCPRRRAHPAAGPRSALARARHALHRLALRARRTWAAFCSFMTVPLWSALLSLIVACAAPVKHALEQHLQPVNEAIAMCGKCAVPLTLVVLGAYFYVPPPEIEAVQSATGQAAGASAAQQNQRVWKRIVRRVQRVFGRGDNGADGFAVIKIRQQRSAADRPRPKETLTVVLAILARMILTPLLLMPLMTWATSEDWHVVFDDPVFVVVNTLLLCSPPALTLAQITAAVSGDAFERLISRTIFWSYCIVTPAVTIGSVLLGLWLAKV